MRAGWYREGMHAVVSRWRKAVYVNGDYVEKSRVYREHAVIMCANFIHSELIVCEKKNVGHYFLSNLRM